METNIFILVHYLNCYLNISSLIVLISFSDSAKPRAELGNAFFNQKNDLFKEIYCSVLEKILILTNEKKNNAKINVISFNYIWTPSILFLKISISLFQLF